MTSTERTSALRRLCIVLLAVTTVAGANSLRSAQGQPQRPFDANTVLELARHTASEGYIERRIASDSPLDKLNYDQYRDIRFNPEAGIWRNESVPFRLELMPAGFLFRTPVGMTVVENHYARDVVATPRMFLVGPLASKHVVSQDIPFSGFRVRTRLNSRSAWDEFLVFQGASYFRAVGRDATYGLSARGLALRTAHPAGEEFPQFTRFWVERPSPNASSVVVHALLDSPSVAGAYRFLITPGIETVMDVEMTLFPRVALDNVGIAPLTSMFLFDESDRSRIDDFRDEVHDSDGLQIVMASGERVWRPLANPMELQVSSFTSEAPKAFGLIQRSRLASDYHDLEARYETRPSAWIEPTSNWGAGSVQLVEIPSDRETNDNIVALWRPREVLPAGKPWHATYKMRWNTRPKLTPVMGRVTSTRTGPSPSGKRRIFVIELLGAGHSIEGIKIDAGT